MANDNEQLILTVGVDGSLAAKGFDQLTKEAKKAGEEAGSGFGSGFANSAKSSFENLGSALIKGIGFSFAASIAAASAALVKATHDASETQNAINNLNSSLASAGNYSKEASDKIVGLASELQQTTRFSDDAVLSAASFIETISRVDSGSLVRATRASADLASSLGIDLQSASTLVAKALDGNVAALSRYGISVRQGVTETEKINNALKALESRFGGRATQEALTFSGTITKLSNNFSDALKSIGNYVIKSPVIIGLLTSLSKAFATASENISKAFGNRDIFGPFLKDLITVIGSVVVFGSKAVEIFTNLGLAIKDIFGAAFSFIFKLVAGTLGAIGDLVAKAGISWGKDLASSADYYSSYAASLTTQFTEGAAQNLQGAIDQPVSESINKTVNDILAGIPSVSNASKLLGDSAKQNVEQSMDDINKKVNATISNIIAWMGDASTKIDTSARTIARSLNMHVVSGFTNAFAAVGAALVKGENAFNAFAGGVIASFGDILIQLGSATLAAGIGMSTVPVLFAAQGPAAVGAGIAMIVAGGALKAFGAGLGGGSSIGGGAATTGGGGGGAGGGDLSAPQGDQFAMSQEDVRAKKGTEVNVIVQGNVLDRRETGLEIVQILRESFDQEGTVLVTG